MERNESPCIMCGKMTANYLVLDALSDPDPVCPNCECDATGYLNCDDDDDDYAGWEVNNE